MLPDYKDPSASNVNAAMYACLQPATRDQVYDYLVELDRARVDTATSPDRAVIKGGRRIKGGARKGKKAQNSVQSPAPAFSFGGSSAVYTFGAAPAQDAGTPMFGGRGAASAAAATAFSFDGASAPTCTPPILIFKCWCCTSRGRNSSIDVLCIYKCGRCTVGKGGCLCSSGRVAEAAGGRQAWCAI